VTVFFEEGRMGFGASVLLVYAALMLAGGVMGYAKAGSKPSLIAGSASAVVLVIAWGWSRSSVAGLWLGAVVAVALCVVFGLRLRKTGKIMPSGVMLAISVLAAAALAFAAAAS
jgi:uncharacterized membrane protein (UPF0136 family)